MQIFSKYLYIQPSWEIKKLYMTKHILYTERQTDTQG